MADASSLPAATVVARLSTDGATARQVGDLLAESFDAEQVAASAFEQPDGHWSLALHFSHHPDETAVRALIASVAGTATPAEGEAIGVWVRLDPAAAAGLGDRLADLCPPARPR